MSLAVGNIDHEALHFLDENTRGIVNVINDGLVIIDMDRQIRFVNDKAAKILGYDPKEMIGCSCKKMLRTSMCDTDCPLTQGILTGKDLTDCDIKYTRKDNSPVQAKSSFKLLRNSQGEIVGGAEIFSDFGEIENLQNQLRKRYALANLVGKSYRMQEVFRLVSEVAQTDVPVLIYGESGTGKELIARGIHQLSSRRSSPFNKVNCGNVSESFLECELFGCSGHAVAGEHSNRKGFFKQADNGIIYLAEIDKLSESAQRKLLRVLKDEEYAGAGDDKNRSVRIITSTKTDLKEAVDDGMFLDDLYYRLIVVPVELPALRERKEDVPLLVDHFIENFNQLMPEKSIRGISPDGLNVLMDYSFPGNVRELETIIEHCFIKCREELIGPAHFPSELISARNRDLNATLQAGKPLKDLEKEMIRLVLRENKGHLQKSAEQLGISRVTLWRRLKKHNLKAGAW